MRRYLIGIISIVLIAGTCTFLIKKVSAASKKTSVRYLRFNLDIQGPQEKVVTNYTLLANLTPPPACPGAVKVCWIRVFDLNDDGIITQAEFNMVVTPLDTDLDGMISDDQIENTTTYQEKA